MSAVVPVAVGCLIRNGEVLIGQRLARQSFAGEWEFPGGKLEANETPVEALVREFKEETGLTTSNWQPLISYPWTHQLPSGSVRVQLHVYLTEQASGQLSAPEGHLFAWCPLSMLDQRHLLRANKGIVRALQLPSAYMITGGFHDQQDALSRLEQALKGGVKLVQLRAKHLDKPAYIALANEMVKHCHGHDAKLIVNTSVAWFDEMPAVDGLQLASSELVSFTSRPVGFDKLLGVSTHNAFELAKATELEADFALLSPVKATQTHPDSTPLGWAEFESMTQALPIPVYALGGLGLDDLLQAKAAGAQGIAAINSLWLQAI